MGLAIYVRFWYYLFDKKGAIIVTMYEQQLKQELGSHNTTYFVFRGVILCNPKTPLK